MGRELLLQLHVWTSSWHLSAASKTDQTSIDSASASDNVPATSLSSDHGQPRDFMESGANYGSSPCQLQESMNQRLVELEEIVDSLAKGLSEATLLGPGTERRQSAKRLLRKYYQIKSLKARALSGVQLDKLQLTKVRSELSVLRALAWYWESKVHLEVGDVEDIEDVVEETEVTAVLGESCGGNVKELVDDLGLDTPSESLHVDHTITCGVELNEDSQLPYCQPVENEVAPSQATAPCFIANSTLTPWQLAAKRAKKNARDLMPKKTQARTVRTLVHSDVCGVGADMQLKERLAPDAEFNNLNEQARVVMPKTDGVRRRWGSCQVQGQADSLCSILPQTHNARPSPTLEGSCKVDVNDRDSCLARVQQTHKGGPSLPLIGTCKVDDKDKCATRAERHCPPPAILSLPNINRDLRPQLKGLQVLVVGDSGLSLSKSKGTAGFDWELKEALGTSVEIARFGGEGAEAMVRFLQGKNNADVVVAVWFLNELFTGNQKLVPSYPSFMDSLAIKLADTLQKFPYHLAVVGGEARLWNTSREFDVYAERVRSILMERGIWIVDGVDCYSNLSMTKDGWHARSTCENKWCMASYFANLVRSVVAESPAR